MSQYFIHTLGCQSNKSDAQRIAGKYQELGWKPASSWQEADELVINTCAIRQAAEHRARGFLQKIKLYLAKNPAQKKPKIILTGCMLHHGEEKLKQMLPQVDEFWPAGQVGFTTKAERDDPKHAFVPISMGCNSFCSYCIVPLSRGREKSRPMAEILAEIEDLITQGYEEITLLGMNVNSWGLEKVGVGLRKLLMRQNLKRSDLPDNQSQYLRPNGLPPFVKLLQKISQFPQIKVIRFLSSNPWDFYDELIEEVIKNKKIDRYVHLPIQSGSDSVLKRMNRGYSVKDYLRIVDKLRQGDPEIVIGTDIIVGFPGESDEEFEQTRALAQKIGWQIGFVAMYSPRPGTASTKIYHDDVPYKIKKQRWEILDQIINKNNLARRPKVV